MPKPKADFDRAITPGFLPVLGILFDGTTFVGAVGVVFVKVFIAYALLLLFVLPFESRRESRRWWSCMSDRSELDSEADEIIEAAEELGR